MGATISRTHHIRNIKKPGEHSDSGGDNTKREGNNKSRNSRNSNNRKSQYGNEANDRGKDNNDNQKTKKKIWPFKSSLQNSREVLLSFDEAMDDAEIDRLQLQHHMYRVIWSGNFKAPVEELLKSGECSVLDIGCSSGIWVAEMAVDYSSANIIGVDKVKMFPDQKPYNAQFILGDVLKTLPFQNNNFDLVHFRGFTFWFTEEDWKRGIQEAIRVLKPGGYLELMEARVIPMGAGPKTERLLETFKLLMKSRNLNPDIVEKLKEYLINTGQFSYIHCQMRKIPYGPRGGKIGQISTFNLSRMSTMQKSKLAPFLNIKESQFEDEIVNPAIRETSVYDSYFPLYRFYAKKKISLDEELIVNDEIRD